MSDNDGWVIQENEDGFYDSFAVPSQFTNNIPDARECIRQGDYFGMEGMDTSVESEESGERISYPINESYEVGIKVDWFTLTWPVMFFIIMGVMVWVYWWGINLIFEQWLKNQ